MNAKAYGTIGLACLSWFTLAVLALHGLDRGVSVTDGYASEYALGDWGWLMHTAFYAIGLGSIAIAIGLRATLAKGKRAALSWTLLVIAGIGLIAAGTFDTDPTGATATTSAGLLHDLAAFLVFSALLWCAWAFRGVFARDPRFAQYKRSALVMAIVVSAGFAVAFVLPIDAVGVAQRITIAANVAFLASLAVRTRQVGAADGVPDLGSAEPSVA